MNSLWGDFTSSVTPKPNQNPMYRIEFKSRQGGYSTYNFQRFAGINELAKYLNNRSKNSPHSIVVEVTLTECYDKDGEPIHLLPLELNTQKFIETYEERLVETYYLKRYLV
jgi:hypothetical protein